MSYITSKKVRPSVCCFFCLPFFLNTGLQFPDFTTGEHTGVQQRPANVFFFFSLSQFCFVFLSVAFASSTETRIH